MNLNLGDTQLIIAECARSNLSLQEAAYVLGTGYHETAHTMKPVRETLAATDAQAISRLEYAWSRGKLPWVKTPYWRVDSNGVSWLGRGYVQLTHRDNYVRMGQRLGVSLAADPTLAMRSDTAAKILVIGSKEGLFTGRKLSDYINATRTDYVGARRIINGTDKAAAIAKLAQAYEAALQSSNYSANSKGVQRPRARATGSSILELFSKWLSKL